MATSSPEPLVALRGVVRRYRSGGATVVALRDVDLELGSGELLAVVGPSGSGKTTLLSLIGGLDRPDSGTIRVGELQLDGLRAAELAEYRRRQVGFVFQSAGLVPLMTAAENVALALELQGVDGAAAGVQALEALASVGLEERARHRGHELSGGEQQRVALARALVKRPLLLLADEPTGQLDTETGLAVMRLISSLRGSHTSAIVATHDEVLAGMADRVMHLEDGCITSPPA